MRKCRGRRRSDRMRRSTVKLAIQLVAAALMVLCVFSMPVRFTEPLVFLLLLNAAAQVAVIQRAWSRR